MDGAPKETTDFMDAQSGMGGISIIGGTGVISKDTAESLAMRHWGDPDSYSRADGKTRYDTARIIADWFTQSGTSVKNTGIGLASGETLVDALPAGVLLATKYKPLLFAQENHVSCGTADYLYDYKDQVSTGYIFGGTSVISPSTEFDAESLMSGSKTPADVGC
jgi:hypothetical protein